MEGESNLQVETLNECFDTSIDNLVMIAREVSIVFLFSHISDTSAELLLSSLSSRELKNLFLNSVKALINIGTHHISFINKST